MSVPKFFEFFEVFLKGLSDGKTHKAKEIREFIADAMNISAEDLADLLPSKRRLHSIAGYAAKSLYEHAPL